jgi:hypothetical protein
MTTNLNIKRSGRQWVVFLVPYITPRLYKSTPANHSCRNLTLFRVVVVAAQRPPEGAWNLAINIRAGLRDLGSDLFLDDRCKNVETRNGEKKP